MSKYACPLCDKILERLGARRFRPGLCSAAGKHVVLERVGEPTEQTKSWYPDNVVHPIGTVRRRGAKLVIKQQRCHREAGQVFWHVRRGKPITEWVEYGGRDDQTSEKYRND